MDKQHRYIVGTMTGTSIDGIDVALIEVQGSDVDMAVTFLEGLSDGFRSSSMTAQLRNLADQIPMTSKDITILSRDLALIHTEAIKRLIDNYCIKHHRQINVDLLVVHGQTVFHAPPFLSWQMFNPSPLAHALQVPVVFDLRSADIGCGGNGAPITPLADWIIFRDPKRIESRAIINLGGFCNITLIAAAGSPADSVGGGDVCACNQLLDSVARLRLGQPYDVNGDAAMSGRVIPEISAMLEAKLREQSSSRLSLGTADEPSSWLAQFVNENANDVARSACRAIAKIISSYLVGNSRSGSSPISRIILAGGGVQNQALVAELHSCCPNVQSAAEFGIPPEFREAIEMAVLGTLCADRVPITLSAVTGVPSPEPISGLWCYPTNVNAKYCGPVLPLTNSEINDDSLNAVNKFLAATRQPSQQELPPDRGDVFTELRNPRTMQLHSLSVEECVKCFQEEDETVFKACKAGSKSLVALLEASEAGFNRGGRIIYLGAGSSGRLGVLDASEAPPTFHVDPTRVVGIIAGGDTALRKSSEGAEDDPNGAIDQLEALALCSDDLVVGIAAGGSTPYVIGALKYAGSLPFERRPVTGFVTCAAVAVAPTSSTHIILLPTGPEVVTGSTRLKAGTATKMILNTISTTLMIRSGKVFENLMVDLKASNVKLMDRAARIISTLTGVTREEAFDLLAKAEGSCKVAVVMHRHGLSLAEAERFLVSSGGRLT